VLATNGICFLHHQEKAHIPWEVHTYANGKSKVKVKSCYHHEGTKGNRRYSSYSFLTSTLDGASGQHQAPAALPLDRRLGGPQEMVWTQKLGEKSFASAVIKP
jgi:hypothetical protein